LWLDDNSNSLDNMRIRCKIPGHSSGKALEGLGEGRLSLVAENVDVALEDQVDVTLFTTVDAMVAFMSHPSQHKFAKYPASLFRIITNRRLFVGPSGLHSRVYRLAKWSSAFPAILVFHGGRSDGLEEFAGYPNLTISQHAADCEAYVSFQAAKAAATHVPEISLGSASNYGPEMYVQGMRRTSIVTGADEEAARRVFRTCNRRDLCVVLKEAHFDVRDLKYCGFDAMTLASAGFDVFTLSTTGFSSDQLAQAGLPTDRCIVFNGYIYKTLRDHDPSAVHLIDDHDELHKHLEPGWQISPATPDALHVCAAYPWATHALVLADGSAYYTALARSIWKTPGKKAKSECLIRHKEGHSVIDGGIQSDILISRQLFCGDIASLRYERFPVSDLQSSNRDFGNLKSRGFSAMELKSGGFDARALYLAGFSGPELQSIGFDINSLDATSLISAASSLNVALAMTGFSKEQLEKAEILTDRCIVFNGYIYKTLGDHDPSSIHVIGEFGKLYDLEPGWQISPATPDALHVCAAYPWAAAALVLADESAYFTALAVAPGAKAKSNWLVTAGGKYGAVDDRAYGSVDDWVICEPTFADVLVFRKSPLSELQSSNVDISGVK
jgi:hypothetical protein